MSSPEGKLKGKKKISSGQRIPKDQTKKPQEERQSEQINILSWKDKSKFGTYGAEWKKTGGSWLIAPFFPSLFTNR